MSMQLGLIVTAPLQVALGLVLVVAQKATGRWLLAPRVALRGSSRTLLAVLLSQVGEFAFVVLAVDDVEQCDKLVHELKHRHPHVRIIARARDALHAMSLHDAGAHEVEREMQEELRARGQRAGDRAWHSGEATAGDDAR